MLASIMVSRIKRNKNPRNGGRSQSKETKNSTGKSRTRIRVNGGSKMKKVNILIAAQAADLITNGDTLWTGVS
jgi:hypothetical protein